MDPNSDQLTDDRDVLEAQRDHYRDRCTELENELNECKNLLKDKFQTFQYDIDPSVFRNESLERLQEWQKCLNFCIEEETERTRLNRKVAQEADGQQDSARAKESVEGSSRVSGNPRDFETELPFSPVNLAGFLTKNHKLTQGRTQYPEPRPKKH